MARPLRRPSPPRLERTTPTQCYCSCDSSDNSGLGLNVDENPHWTQAHKFVCKSFDVACIQCEHSHLQQQVPFACVCACASGVDWVLPAPLFLSAQLLVRTTRTATAWSSVSAVTGTSSCSLPAAPRTSTGWLISSTGRTECCTFVSSPNSSATTSALLSPANPNSSSFR